MSHMGRKSGYAQEAVSQIGIRVSDFGPISEASVALRPLTVFVGASNTGKTYLANLIYILHRILSGFKAPFGGDWSYLYEYILPNLEKILFKAHNDRVATFFKSFSNREKQIRWSHLPDMTAEDLTESPSGLGLKEELSRCFDLTNLNELVNSRTTCGCARVGVTVNDNNTDDWSVKFEISHNRILQTINIKDLLLVPNELGSDPFMPPRLWLGPTLERLLWQYDQMHETQMRKDLLSRLVSDLVFAMRNSSRHSVRRSIHYLPAARSGIMQSHRIIASSLVLRSTRAGVEQIKEIPTFAGPLADFVKSLLLFKPSKETDAQLEKIAQSLEHDILAGTIRGRSRVAGTYPEFVYRPSSSPSNIGLSRASSMVSELAPLVLFLRGVGGRNSTVIIEEPEAHLHPAAQAQIAVTLADMVRAGLQVIVTTHSDWLLKEISNLIRKGLLSADDDSCSDSNSISRFLRKEEVGVWLFRDSESGSTVQEIEFDTSEGLEPREYEDVEEELYNQAATLQNRLEEQSPK